MMSEYQSLSTKQFADWFGSDPSNLSLLSQQQIAATNLRFRMLSQAERDAVILRILTQLDLNKFARVGKERQGIWEMAWAERAQIFTSNAHELAKLTPNYNNIDPVVRLGQEYVMPEEAGLELRFSPIFRQVLFENYLRPFDAIYEFGCGSGINLSQLAQLFPEKTLMGLDWAQPAVDLVNLIATKHNFRLSSRRFDFFSPDETLQFMPNSAVLTMCALEQIGDKHEAFVDFLMQRKPALCVHMEPLEELYAPQNLVDYIGLRYHTQRGYLAGFVTKLRQLAAERVIEIVRLQRVPFGNLYHEGYSYIVWRPIHGSH